MPRITISLPDDFYTLFKDYSVFMGRPPATVASQCLMEMRPSIEVVSKAMRKAEKAMEEAEGSKQASVDELRAFIVQELGRVTADASHVTDELDAFDNGERAK